MDSFLGDLWTHPSYLGSDPGPGVKKDPSKTFYSRDVLKLLLKRTLTNIATDSKEEEHNHHQHMKTKAVDNEVRRGGTTSPGPSVKTV